MIAFLCANGAVVSFAVGNHDAQWVLWLGLFLTMEVAAAISREKGDTLSERVWVWIGLRPRKPARWVRVPCMGEFIFVLGAHFVTDGAFWWTGGLGVVLSGLPVGVIIAYAVIFERKAQWKTTTSTSPTPLASSSQSALKSRS